MKGAWIVDLERREDERGFFARAWCEKEFAARGLIDGPVQANIAFTRRRGTIRGLHYQVAPFEEAKIVRCVKGAIWDVMIDLRPDSDTYCQWLGFELTAANQRQVYVPKGFAHGYQTLVDDCEVFYFVSEFYAPAAERGIRWNDARFGITWPVLDGVDVSPKDQAWDDFRADSASVALGPDTQTSVDRQ